MCDDETLDAGADRIVEAVDPCDRHSTPSVSAQITASVRYGTASLVAWASAAPPAAPSACPGAHATLISDDEYPNCSPRSSATFESSVIPGVKNVPNASPAATTTTASTTASDGHGSNAATTTDAARPATSGGTGPTRSETRPSRRLLPASSAAEQRKTAPIATAPKPSAPRRSGARTPSVPNRSAGSSTNQPAKSIRRSPSARRSSDGLCGSGRRGLLVAAAHATSANEATPIAPNVGAVPATDATPPTTGPNNAPNTAAANTFPIRRPRRAGGASVISHPSAPVHVNADAVPWTKRAASSCHASCTRPKTIVQTPTSVMPAITVGLNPTRVATIPLGSDATSTPAGYAAASTPAPVFPRPSASV